MPDAPDLSMAPFLELSLEVRSIADFTGTIHWVNEAYETSLGYTVEELNEIAWHRLAHPADLPRVMAQVATMARGRMGKVDVRLRCRDGTFKWFRICAKVAPGPGHPMNRLFYTSGQEITDAKEVAAAQDRFIANAAHELRTPTSLIAALVDTLSRHRDSMTDEEVAEALHLLERHSRRAERLARNLLEHSRAELVDNPVRIRPLDLHEAVTEATAHASVADAVEVDLRVPEGTQVLADPERLDQILVNLLTNVRRYGGERVTITTTEPADGGIECRVHDDGPGVPDHFTDRLFEPFERAQPAGVGTGLGLAIARRLARAQDGELRYEPTDDGACFVLELRSDDPLLGGGVLPPLPD